MILLAQKERFSWVECFSPTLPDPLVDWLKFAPEAKDWLLEAWASHKSRDPQLWVRWNKYSNAPFQPLLEVYVNLLDGSKACMFIIVYLDRL